MLDVCTAIFKSIAQQKMELSAFRVVYVVHVVHINKKQIVTCIKTGTTSKMRVVHVVQNQNAKLTLGGVGLTCLPCPIGLLSSPLPFPPVGGSSKWVALLALVPRCPQGGSGTALTGKRCTARISACSQHART